MLPQGATKRDLVLRLIMAEVLARRGEGPLARPIVLPVGRRPAAPPPEPVGAAQGAGEEREP